MARNLRMTIATLACIVCLMASALVACAGDSAKSSAASSESSEAVEATTTREDVEPLLNAASEAAFNNVTYSAKTETSAVGSDSNGQTQSRTVKTVTKGEFDRSGEKPRMHLVYEGQSNVELGKTTYEMFIDGDRRIVQQDGEYYVDDMTDEMLDSYAKSVTSIMAADEIKEVLDLAESYKMQENDDGTMITVTLDKDKLSESQQVEDAATLPDSTQVATMVVSYDIDKDGHFRAIRLMSSTSGSPTYHVSQAYEFANYDTTVMPEWPDLKAYIAEKLGIPVEEVGDIY